MVDSDERSRTTISKIPRGEKIGEGPLPALSDILKFLGQQTIRDTITASVDRIYFPDEICCQKLLRRPIPILPQTPKTSSLFTFLFFFRKKTKKTKKTKSEP